MTEFDTTVLEVIQRTPGVKSFRFKAQEDAFFEAGQYFLLTIKVNDVEETKPFSFSNSPTEKGYIEFTKRITASDFSRTLDGLGKGDKAHIKMPYGSFTLDESREKIAFLSGGIGITPVRSMCKFAADMKLPVRIVLLYGNNSAQDIIFKYDFEDMRKKNRNFRAVYTLTSLEKAPRIKACRLGYIDGNMIREEVPDFTDRVFYLCGPPEMVRCLRDILKTGLNLPKDRIKTEKFAGY